MLNVINLRKTFNSGTVNERIALNGVNLHVLPGEFVTVIGGNGGGKSTLLSSVAGVFGIDEGQIIIDGSDVTLLPEHKRASHIGRVFQDPMLGTAGNMTIEENIALSVRRGMRRSLRRGVTQREREELRSSLSQLGLGLENRMQTKVGLLSGGQRQALTLLMASVQRPRLLLLDEHTSALDPKTAKKILTLTDRLVRSASLTTLMVTHNMRDAIALGDRLIMMQEGEITLDVSGDEKRNLSPSEIMERFL